MSNNNSLKFILSFSNNITNINKVRINIKFDILANFVCVNHYKLIITTNKVISMSDLNTIEKYIKNTNNIELNNISSSYLL